MPLNMESAISAKLAHEYLLELKQAPSQFEQQGLECEDMVRALKKNTNADRLM